MKQQTLQVTDAAFVLRIVLIPVWTVSQIIRLECFSYSFGCLSRHSDDVRILNLTNVRTLIPKFSFSELLANWTALIGLNFFHTSLFSSFATGTTGCLSRLKYLLHYLMDLYDTDIRVCHRIHFNNNGDPLLYSYVTNDCKTKIVNLVNVICIVFL